MGDVRCPCVSSAQGAGSFGISCRPHFNESVPAGSLVSRVANCTASDVMPKWCSSAWCFIDIANCSLPSQPMIGFALPYSFETCGYLDTFSQEVTVDEMKSQTLEVVYLTSSGGFMGGKCTASNSECTGPTATFWQQVFKRSGARIDVQARFTDANYPNHSIPFQSRVMQQFNREAKKTDNSTFNACLYATGMGFVDVCVGAYTVNPERHATSNLVEYYENNVLLVVRRQVTTQDKTQTALQSINKAWEPFSWGVWLSIAVACITSTFCMTLHDRVLSCSSDSEWRSLKTWADAEHYVSGIAFVVYEAWLAFWSGGRTVHDPQTVGAKIVSMGLAVFVLMITAAYTANLASFLVVQQYQQSTGGLTSLQDVLDQNGIICIHNSLVSVVTGKAKVSNANILSIPDRSKVLSSVVEGLCTAAVLRDEDLVAAHFQKTFCEYISIQNLFTVPIAVAVSKRAMRPLKYFANQEWQAGGWEDAVAKAEVIDLCPGPLVGTGSAGSAAQLPFPSVSGPILVTCIFFVLSFLPWILRKLTRCLGYNNKKKVTPISSPEKKVSMDQCEAMEDLDKQLQETITVSKQLQDVIKSMNDLRASLGSPPKEDTPLREETLDLGGDSGNVECT